MKVLRKYVNRQSGCPAPGLQVKPAREGYLDPTPQWGDSDSNSGVSQAGRVASNCVECGGVRPDGSTLGALDFFGSPPLGAPDKKPI